MQPRISVRKGKVSDETKEHIDMWTLFVSH